MSRVLELHIPVAPVPQKETSFNKATGFAYTPTEKRDYMLMMADAMREFSGYFKGAEFLRLHVLFVCERPKVAPPFIPSALWKSQTEFRKPSRPDMDNYLKPLLDSMSNHVIEKKKNKDGDVTKINKGAGVIDEDSQIVSLYADKIYAKIGESPRMEVKIVELGMFYTRMD